MAEFVSSFVSQAIQTTLNLLLASLKSVAGDIDRLRSDHNRIQCFLRDADHNRVGNWITELKDLSWDIEDLIVEASTAGIIHHRRIRSQIDLVRTKMEDILRSKQAFGVELSGGKEDQRPLRRPDPYYDEDEDQNFVVGFRDSTEALMSQLTEVEYRLRVVSIVGMGGSGKTTLAKMAYNRSETRSHFERRAWVCVSQNCSAREILTQVLVQIDRRKFDTLEEKRDKREVLRGLEERDLVDSVRAELREKRYLLVLDDVWGVQEWDRVRIAFPRGTKGSKILLTTRNQQVASLADPAGVPIEPPLLSPEESSELLRRSAFSGEAKEFPRGFEGPGREIARRCGGLPLGIVALGGLLSTKRSVEEWERVLRDLSSRIYDGVSGILSLSYDDLPYHLKPCFLYLSIFPEDREIPKRSLVQLWIAEGLIPRLPNREEEEETAERYLEELVNRSMIRASTRNSFGIKTYQIHDLTREFCVSKAEEENFFKVIRRQQQRGDFSFTIIRSRRVAIHLGCDFDTFQVKTRLRSLLCFATGKALNLSSCFRGESFAMLRSLELGSNRFRVTFAMLKRICKLVHLMYLGLRDTGLHKLPDCLGNLRNLETLDLRDNWEIWILPAGISNLANLRPLLISALRLNYKSSWTRSTAFRMNNLRYFSLGNHKTWIGFDSLVKLKHLQNLRIEFTCIEEVTALIESPVVQSGRLRSLEMEIPSGDTFPNLRLLSRCRNLKSLGLVGRIENETRSFCRRSRKTTMWLQYLPPSTKKLTLRHSCIGLGHVAALEKLPNLTELQLSDEAYSEPVMVFSGGRFPKLVTLQLCHLSALKEWRVERGAMPSLERLRIQDNSELRTVPQGLGFVNTLRRIDVIDMKKSFGERIRVSGDGTEGEDFNAIRHVSSISIIDTNDLHSK